MVPTWVRYKSPFLKAEIVNFGRFNCSWIRIRIPNTNPYLKEPKSLQIRMTMTHWYFTESSVADPGCLSRIPDPDFYPSRISDPGSKNSKKREGWKKNFCHNFFVATNFTKLHIILVLMKKKIWANFQTILKLFTQKIVNKLSKIWIWDPGSRGQKGTGSWIRNTDRKTMSG